jgi:hypothetical protein
MEDVAGLFMEHSLWSIHVHANLLRQQEEAHAGSMCMRMVLLVRDGSQRSK